MTNSFAATAAVIPGLEHAALVRQPKHQTPSKKPYLNSTASETTLVNQSQKMTSSKAPVKDEELDSDEEDLKSTPSDKSREKSLSGSITKTMSKVKSKFKGSSSSNQQGSSASQKGGPSTQKGTVYNPNALSTWRAISEFK
ncbi:hypothetical protein MGN70_009038 [Eutypa lata]|nr:hypothetical protein MGN70_009038 [Eutypa lata]